MSLRPLQVCVPCRERKRKCDKGQPRCSLCQRLHRDCTYESVSPNAQNLRGDDDDDDGQNRVSNRSSWSFPSANPQPLRSVGYGDIAEPHFNVDSAVTKHLSGCVGDVHALRHVVTKYFNTVHLWLPIISEARFLDRLPVILLEPQADLSLLALSMALITTVPLGIDAASSAPPIYTIVKCSLAVVEAANIHSLEVLQARLLLSLFEVGHGIDPAAYITLGATTRAAVAMGANLESGLSYIGREVPLERSDEALCVWWAILILDRYHTLERGLGPCATEKFGQPNQLPRDKIVCDQAALRPDQPFDISTPSSVPVGPFARQAQVSHLLNRLLTHIQEPTYSEVFNLEERKLVARTLDAFSKLLPEEAPQPCPRYCGAIGMCYSALAVVLQINPRAGANQLTDSSFEPTLESMLYQITEIARKFNAQIDDVDVEALSPFVANSLYMAIVAQRRLYQETHDEGIWDALSSLEITLGHFSKRWSNAGKYLRLLGQAQGAWHAQL